MQNTDTTKVYRENVVLKTWQKGGVMSQLICNKVTGWFYIFKPVGNKTNAMRSVNSKMAGFILSSNLSL